MAGAHSLAAELLAPVRVRGGVDVAFSKGAGETYAGSVFETGGYRVLFPKACGRTEAVVINTGGGIAGGDQVRFAFQVGPRAHAVVTSQAAERIYRSLGPAARIDVHLDVAENASCLWLPQETILYADGRLARRFEADISPSATLLMGEIAVFGREAMGEAVTHGAFMDTWRIRRGGKLTFADTVALEGPIAELLARKSVAAGARVVATLLLVAPSAEDRLEAVRTAIADSPMRAAASSWNGLLLMRIIGGKVEEVRHGMAAAVRACTGAGMPRVWGF